MMDNDYRNTFGKRGENAVLDYLMDKLELMDAKEARAAHKYLGDLIAVTHGLRDMKDRNLLKHIIQPVRARFTERAKTLNYPPHIMSRLLAMAKREFSEVWRYFELIEQDPKLRWKWRNGMRVPGNLKALCALKAEAREGLEELPPA